MAKQKQKILISTSGKVVLGLIIASVAVIIVDVVIGIVMHLNKEEHKNDIAIEKFGITGFVGEDGKGRRTVDIPTKDSMYLATTKDELDQYFLYSKEPDFSSNNYLVLLYTDYCNGTPEFDRAVLENQKLTIKTVVHTHNGLCGPSDYAMAWAVPKSIASLDQVELDEAVDKSNYNPREDVSYKPILYLYPEVTKEISVKYVKSDLLTSTYPKYEDGWNVVAYPDGTLIDEDSKEYYALYWEGIDQFVPDFSTGFYVEKDDVAEFLEEKLEQLGLSARERNEFIMYWLPKLEENGKSLVYFALTDDLNEREPLEFSVSPESLLRVRMYIKKVDEKSDIVEQELPPFERKGFAAVEWGGTVIN